MAAVTQESIPPLSSTTALGIARIGLCRSDDLIGIPRSFDPAEAWRAPEKNDQERPVHSLAAPRKGIGTQRLPAAGWLQGR
jgi:hypothetical protein